MNNKLKRTLLESAVAFAEHVARPDMGQEAVETGLDRKDDEHESACEQIAWLNHLARLLGGANEAQSYAEYCSDVANC